MVDETVWPQGYKKFSREYTAEQENSDGIQDVFQQSCF